MPTRTTRIRSIPSKRPRSAAAGTARRSRCQRSSGCNASVARVRTAHADLADGVRLSDEPPDQYSRRLKTLQARYLSEAAYRAFAARNVDSAHPVPLQGRGLRSGAGRAAASPSAAASSSRTVLRSFPSRRFRASAFGRCCGGKCGRATGRGATSLQQFRDGGWRAVGGVARTNASGFLSRTVQAGSGATFRLRDPSGDVVSPLLRISCSAPVRAAPLRKARRPSWPSSLVRRSAILRAVSRPVRPVEDELLRLACSAAARRCAARRAPVRRPSQIRVDLVHQPDSQGGRCVEALTRDEVAARPARPDLRERERRDHRRDDAELHLRECEHGPVVRDCDVRARHEARSATEGVALDARDDRSRTAVDRLSIPRRAFASATFASKSRSTDARIHSTSAPAQKLGPSPASRTARALADVDERLGELGDQRGVEGVRVSRGARA